MYVYIPPPQLLCLDVAGQLAPSTLHPTNTPNPPSSLNNPTNQPQLERLRAARVRLTVCVDKVAASGGYMMACVADRLLAAPFATLGSIGATTSVPILNVEKLLTRFGVRAYAVRSGKHKGGGPVLVGDARADQEALAKLQEDLVRFFEGWGLGMGRGGGDVRVSIEPSIGLDCHVM